MSILFRPGDKLASQSIQRIPISLNYIPENIGWGKYYLGWGFIFVLFCTKVHISPMHWSVIDLWGKAANIKTTSASHSRGFFGVSKDVPSEIQSVKKDMGWSLFILVLKFRFLRCVGLWSFSEGRPRGEERPQLLILEDSTQEPSLSRPRSFSVLSFACCAQRKSKLIKWTSSQLRGRP